MVGALLSFCVMAVAIRKLSGPLTVMEILTLRAGARAGDHRRGRDLPAAERHSINTRRLPLHILRNSVPLRLAISVGAWPWCCCRSPPCSRSSSPCRPGRSCWRRFFLGERMTRSRVGAVISRPRRRAGDPAARRRELQACRPDRADRRARLWRAEIIATKKLTATKALLRSCSG